MLSFIPELQHALNAFAQMLEEFFGKRLISIVLFGSIIFDDLAPGYGDLDFLAVVDDDLSEEDCNNLVALRKPLRNGDYGTFGRMIEGAFLPRKMLNPAIHGQAFWWGTSGERPWEENQLGWFVLQMIKERGLIFYGEDISRDIPDIDRMLLVNDIRIGCETIKQHGKGGGLHSVDWLLLAARSLLWLKENSLSSKSDAADWGFRNAQGSWRKLLPQAKQIRLNPALADSPEIQQWMNELTPAIQEACEEIERALG